MTNSSDGERETEPQDVATPRPQPSRSSSSAETQQPPQRTKAERWELFREWTGILLGFIGTVVGGLSQCQNAESARQDRELASQNTELARQDMELTRQNLELQQGYKEVRVNTLLNQAWDLLGGRGEMDAVDTIEVYNRDKYALERAKRLIEDALELDPTSADAYRRYH